MKIINFGSLNIDHVYSVENFVTPGETITSHGYQQYCGGKGCNQSLALANAGLIVMHAGKVGADGQWLKNRLAESGVDVSLVANADEPTGHAIIQVSQSGENSIIVHGGANQALDRAYIKEALQKADSGDYVLTQNETSCVPEVLSQASNKGLLVVFNPAPMTLEVNNYPLDKVGLFILNETEGNALTNETKPVKILSSLLSRFPSAGVVLTLGAKGAILQSAKESVHVPAPEIEAIDTTAAGDTFIGFLLAELANGVDNKFALKLACKAAAMCVQKSGATDSIPTRDEVLHWII